MSGPLWEDYYAVLKVSRKATIAEIVSAYHAAKNAFAKDSMATYSLFSAEELQTELEKLERAYLTLSNLEKKAEYDRMLRIREGVEKEQSVRVEAPPPQPAPHLRAVPLAVAEAVAEQATAHDELEVTGAYLKRLREQRKLSLEDVSRVTKIPLRFIRSIESDLGGDLPARVYLQGFVKNLATFYKLDPTVAVKSYLEHLARLGK